MPSPARRHRVLIIGGGNGGLSVAGRLRRAGIQDIAVIEPREQHVFAPLQSYIAGGLARASQAGRPQASVTPRGVAWIRDRVVRVHPNDSSVELESGDRVGYEHLVIAVGLETRHDAVPGLEDAMKRPDGVSSYTLDLAAKASHALRDVRGGTVVFVQQPEPASAAGVSQKPMYLACDWWRARGVLAGIRVVFLSPEPAAFGIPAISSELQRALDAYGIESRFSARVREVRTGEVVIEQDGRTEVLAYDLLHAAPPQSPPAFIAASGLSDPADPHGFVDNDPGTLRSRRFANVWAVGDAATVDTLRSGGGIRPQAKVVTTNIRAALRAQSPTARYDGYSVCPITVSRRALVFAEFDGRGRLAPTVPGWKSLYRARRLSFLVDRHILPWVYWNLILKGRA
ncbi:FAD/NAD(P)-binding oxidoreductase [Microbacterium sp. NPDC064584]|uniref:NAD(P)/FAD-dependent oxidoreductase n=1 Tax=Microbacterium sp. NPDC064584 TaxID=3155817 RepID=UPI0034397E3B